MKSSKETVWQIVEWQIFNMAKYGAEFGNKAGEQAENESNTARRTDKDTGIR